ncbi:hypothetical protein [Tolypothrix sp. NIES-4075]|uniref:hypothetical protein n=1 Tax=Tolypothrix sp. NIES-4075 TaxID=2005459 RepID=UPI001358A388|nr:hypothetical protein [Tolypothrix sp. NIES-4075]
MVSPAPVLAVSVTMGDWRTRRGNGEWGMGKTHITITNYQLPITDYQLPIPYF